MNPGKAFADQKIGQILGAFGQVNFDDRVIAHGVGHTLPFGQHVERPLLQQLRHIGRRLIARLKDHLVRRLAEIAPLLGHQLRMIHRRLQRVRKIQHKNVLLVAIADAQRVSLIRPALHQGGGGQNLEVLHRVLWRGAGSGG